MSGWREQVRLAGVEEGQAGGSSSVWREHVAVREREAGERLALFRVRMVFFQF